MVREDETESNQGVTRRHAPKRGVTGASATVVAPPRLRRGSAVHRPAPPVVCRRK
ncbi:hypothetical protein Hanom_Chr14g01262501 [Helianthus anomalus]